MVNGSVRYWGDGKVHEKFLEVTSGDVGVIKAEIKWVSEANEVICTSTNTYKIYSPSRRAEMMDCEIDDSRVERPGHFQRQQGRHDGDSAGDLDGA